jgi:hypothetical protein
MAEPVTATSAAVAAISPAVAHSLDRFAKTLAKPVANFARSIIDKAAVDLRVGFQDYLNVSYEKCRCYKTILNPSQPIDLISNYVNVMLSLGHKKEAVKDSYLIHNLDKYRRLVVTGLAGGGKSMFMKYLTLCRFEGEHGQLPLFVELRHMNQLTDRNLLTFVRVSCTSRHSKVTQSQFELSLKAGALTLILDGFDELNYDFRDEIQRQLLELCKDYPETTVIVSSRPDERFGSWASFVTAHPRFDAVDHSVAWE